MYVISAYSVTQGAVSSVFFIWCKNQAFPFFKFETIYQYGDSLCCIFTVYNVHKYFSNHLDTSRCSLK